MPPKSLKLALIGATGLVGRTMLQVLEERRLSVADLYPIASPKSRGTELDFAGRKFQVSTLEEGLWQKAEVALLSAGASVSREWVPKLAAAGVVCIDNSSAFRLNVDVPLVVPEVNPDAIRRSDRIIANPNCSTIQLVMVLHPLHNAFTLEEAIVSTYQSAAGAGQKGKAQLLSEIESNTQYSTLPPLSANRRIPAGNKGGQGGIRNSSPFPHPLYQNLIPAIGPLRENDYYLEELKLVHETRKIISLPELKVFPIAVRVPISHCHGEAVHLRFQQNVSPQDARQILAEAPGIIVQDDPPNALYPLPLKCTNKDEVFVGRIRQMPGASRTLDLWIVADNLRKGAATNAVQILEYWQNHKD